MRLNDAVRRCSARQPFCYFLGVARLAAFASCAWLVVDVSSKCDDDVVSDGHPSAGRGPPFGSAKRMGAVQRRGVMAGRRRFGWKISS